MSNALTNNNINDDGIRNMLVENILNPALNISRYVELGIIKDGKVTDYWPKRKTGPQKGHNLLLRGSCQYRHHAVDDLAYFTDGRCDTTLSHLGDEVRHLDGKTILKYALAGEIANLDLCSGEVVR